MKLFKGKSRRSRIFAAVTLASILVIVALNLLLTYIGVGNTFFADLTPEGLYTLTDGMKNECKFLDDLDSGTGGKKVKITFCTDPDYLTSSIIARTTYFMALQLRDEFPSVEVETVNVAMNPTAVAKYKTTSLSKISASDVIISYGDRYRIVNVENFWTVGSDGTYFSYNGEYKMATILRSVTLANEKQPTAYFLTDHGETYFDPDNPESADSLKAGELASLLYETGLKIANLKLSEVQEIPDDCALLIINNPRVDFTYDADALDRLDYVSDTEKLDRYLVSKQGAIMVAKDYAITLPVLEDFLSEWGFDFGSSVVKDEEASIAGTDGKHIVTVYDDNEESYAYAIYGDFASLTSSPRTVISNTGYIKNSFNESESVNEPGTPNITKTFCKFLTTSAGAKAYLEKADGVELEADEGSHTLAAVTARAAFNTVTAEYTYSYVFCANSADFFSNSLIGSATYANYDIVSALANNISRVDYYASTEIGGTSLNSSSFGGKQLVSTELSTEDKNVYSPDASKIIKVNKGISNTEKIVYAVIVAIAPVAILIVGTVVCVKRKFL